MSKLSQSRVAGTTSEPLQYKTLDQAFEEAGKKFGSREALVVRQQNIRWTYYDLQREVAAFAAGLLALGLSPGERIGIWSPNRYEWVVAQLATAKIGLILVNINPAYRLTELEYALNKVECAALITAAQFKSSDYLGMLNTLSPELAGAEPGKLQAAKMPSLRTVMAIPCFPPVSLILHGV